MEESQTEVKQEPTATITNFNPKRISPDSTMMTNRQQGMTAAHGPTAEEIMPPVHNPPYAIDRKTQLRRWQEFEDDHRNLGGYDEHGNQSAYARKQAALGSHSRPPYIPGGSGGVEFTFSEEDFETPSFLRKQAD